MKEGATSTRQSGCFPFMAALAGEPMSTLEEASTRLMFRTWSSGAISQAIHGPPNFCCVPWTSRWPTSAQEPWRKLWSSLQRIVLSWPGKGWGAKMGLLESTWSTSPQRVTYQPLQSWEVWPGPSLMFQGLPAVGRLLQGYATCVLQVRRPMLQDNRHSPTRTSLFPQVGWIPSKLWPRGRDGPQCWEVHWLIQRRQPIFSHVTSGTMCI